MAREILLSKKTEQGLRLDPRTKLLLIFIISIFVMGANEEGIALIQAEKFESQLKSALELSRKMVAED